MDYKLPYYMAYPMPFEYDDERRERRDFEYMRSMYPEMVKRILPFVEDECDRMEYEGSMIYDEYPDMLGIRMMCSRIFDRINEMGIFDDNEMPMEAPMGMQSESQVEMQQRDRDRDRNRERDENRRRNRGRDIVEILLLQELLRRRNEQRRRRRRFY